MGRRIHPAKRRFLRRYPAPPPTPEGLVYGAQRGRLVLIDADLLRAACEKRMGNFDRLPLQERRNLMRPG